MDPLSPAYNMPVNIRLEHAVDEVAVMKTLDRIFTRHYSFRTAFRTVGDRVFQFIPDEWELPLEVVDISAMDPESKRQKAEKLYIQHAAAPFDLAKAPLFRAKLVKLDTEDFLFMVNMHHIISDGWSMEILKQEMIYLDCHTT